MYEAGSSFLERSTLKNSSSLFLLLRSFAGFLKYASSNLAASTLLRQPPARRDGGVTLVHALDRHTVHTVRPGDKQQPRRELLDEHHALTLEMTSEEDQHLTRAMDAPMLVCLCSIVRLSGFLMSSAG